MCGLDSVRTARAAPRHGVRQPRRSTQRGFSIVEVMVGMVVALLVGLAATGAAMSFSATQRQGIGAGGAAVNAATALAAIKNDTASGGLGFFGDTDFYLCAAMDLSKDATVHMDAAAFAPVRITRAAPHDRLDVIFGTNISAGANVLLGGASSSTTARLKSYMPVTVGQAVLLAPDPTDPLVAAATPCMLRSVTAISAVTDESPQTLTFGATGSHNQGAFTATPAYPENARVALVGAMTWNRYRVSGTDLILERPLDGTSAVIARNVIAFRAQYGVSAAAAGSTTLESWENAEGATWSALNAAAVVRVRAVRMAIVSRSPQRAKADASGNCEATTTKPSLFGAVVEPDVTDWKCYRYTTATVVVPLRNLVIGIQ